MQPAAKREEERLAPIRASVYHGPDGRPIHGLPEQSTKQPLKHAFETGKQEANARNIDRQLAPASGQRVEMKNMLEKQWEENKAAQGGWEPSGKPLPREHLTSKGNPLFAGGFSAPEREGADKVISKRTWNRYALDASRPRLDATLVPIEAPPTEADAQHQPGDDEHNASGEQPDQEHEGQDQEEEQVLLHEAAETGVVVRVSVASMQGQAPTAKQVVAEREKLLTQLAKEYPHGIPKLLAKRLEAQGLLPSGLAPLGFGVRS